jgi:hypothetical protein
VKHYLGSYLAQMNGADAVVFTGGIGENSAEIRARVCKDVDFLGIAIDPAKNQAAVGGKEGDISAEGARVRTYVIPTNEELLIARDTVRCVKNAPRAGSADREGVSTHGTCSSSPAPGSSARAVRAGRREGAAPEGASPPHPDPRRHRLPVRTRSAALARPQAHALQPRPPPRWRPGRAGGDRNAGPEALAGREWDVCIDNPTTLPFWVRDAGRVLKGKVGQYVFISTLSVYASDKEVGQDESAPLAPYKGKDAMKETQETLRADVEALYGPLKALSEKEAETWFPGTATVIRPGLIVGPGDESDRFTYWPVRLDRGGAVLAPGDGSDPVQFVDARDLAEATIRKVESRTLGTFNAMGPAFDLTMGEMLCGIRAATTSKRAPLGRPTS